MLILEYFCVCLTSWIVAVCERSEYKGVWGQRLPRAPEISLLLGGKGVFFERFSGSCTMRQKADGRVSIPPRSAFWGAFWAPFANAVDVGGGGTKVAGLEGLCRALRCQMGMCVCVCEGGRRARA